MPLPWIRHPSGLDGLSDRSNDNAPPIGLSLTPTIAVTDENNSTSDVTPRRSIEDRPSATLAVPSPPVIARRGNEYNAAASSSKSRQGNDRGFEMDEFKKGNLSDSEDSDDDEKTLPGAKDKLALPRPPVMWRNGSVENRDDLKSGSNRSSGAGGSPGLLSPGGPYASGGLFPPPQRNSMLSLAPFRLHYGDGNSIRGGSLAPSRSSVMSFQRLSLRPNPHLRSGSRGSVWETNGREEIPMEGPDAKNGFSESSTRVAEDEALKLSVTRERLFIFVVCLAQLFAFAGLAQTFAPVLIISDYFDEQNPGEISWHTAAYMMVFGSVILPAGRLGDMFGHKKLFVIGWIWFSVLSFITGFSYAGGPTMLSATRGLQGIAPAILVPNGIALLGRNFPIGMKRATALAIFGGCGSVGFVIGVVFSSIFAQLVWWPWAFWVMAMACILICGLAQVCIPPDTSDTSGPESRDQFDLLGCLTGVAGLLLINFALNQAPVMGWHVAYVPILLAVGIILMAIFVHVELNVALKPLVPLRGLHRDAAYTLACIAAGWASNGVWSYYFFLFTQSIRGDSALSTAAQICPVAFIGFAAAIAVPFILKRVKIPYVSSLKPVLGD